MITTSRTASFRVAICCRRLSGDSPPRPETIPHRIVIPAHVAPTDISVSGTRRTTKTTEANADAASPNPPMTARRSHGAVGTCGRSRTCSSPMPGNAMNSASPATIRTRCPAGRMITNASDKATEAARDIWVESGLTRSLNRMPVSQSRTVDGTDRARVPTICDAWAAMRTSDSVVIIVLNWNRRDETRRCIKSCPVSQRIYVLNNGCDESELYVHEGRPRETVISSSSNLGYAAGVNLLASLALADGAQWLLLLNNDATLEPGALAEVSTATGLGVAAVCPMVIDHSSGRVWSVGGRISARTGRVSSNYHGWEPDAVPDVSQEVDFGTGACLLISGQAMREIGGLDATYFAYWEETDWCRRATDAGYRIITCPTARATHVGGVSSTPSLRLHLMTRNGLLYLRRHSSRRELLRFLPAFLLWTLPTWSVRPFLADPKRTLRAVGLALAWHLRPLPDPSIDLPETSGPRSG